MWKISLQISRAVLLLIELIAAGVSWGWGEVGGEGEVDGEEEGGKGREVEEGGGRRR